MTQRRIIIFEIYSFSSILPFCCRTGSVFGDVSLWFIIQHLPHKKRRILRHVCVSDLHCQEKAANRTYDPYTMPGSWIIQQHFSLDYNRGCLEMDPAPGNAGGAAEICGNESTKQTGSEKKAIMCSNYAEKIRFRRSLDLICGVYYLYRYRDG